MATFDFTFAINTNAGAVVRRMALQLEAIAAAMPDNNHSGASIVIRFDNAPSTGIGTVQAQAGPYQTAALPF